MKPFIVSTHDKAPRSDDHRSLGKTLTRTHRDLMTGSITLEQAKEALLDAGMLHSAKIYLDSWAEQLRQKEAAA